METKKETPTKKQCYFAAANGYAGFLSYFDKVFNSGEYERVFVLKGGPGTGKSSFMRKMSDRLFGEGVEVEEIFCSSDPKSLDGIICSCGDKKAALLDGTAPHERDAKIPGAIDSLINLGDNWDEVWLRGYRGEILSLCSEKSEAYERAYFYLRIAGACHGEIKGVQMRSCNLKKLKMEAKKQAEMLSCGHEGKEKTRLISSFGRYGEYRLDTLKEISKRVLSPVGSKGTAEIFMRELCDNLRLMSAEMTVCPSPFDKEVVEAIYLPASSVLISAVDAGEPINLEFCQDEKSAVSGEGARRAAAIMRDALSEAERWFAIASDLHFRLEEIYSRAMNFDKNDALYENCLDKILALLKP